MNELVRLYHPINTLKKVAKNIWIVDGSIVKMSMYRMQIPFSTRMTVIKLQNDDLWCHSPIELTPKLKESIDRLGSVRYLVSPNKIHYAYIDSWAKIYPNAISWASPGVKERAARQKISVNFDRNLQESVPIEWKNQIEQLIFRGSSFMDEVVFFHPLSKTLILADLIENFEANKLNKISQSIAKLTGVLDPDGKAPLDFRLTFLGNKKQAKSCLSQMIEWQPERIILAHGRYYENNAIEELKRAFRWLK